MPPVELVFCCVDISSRWQTFSVCLVVSLHSPEISLIFCSPFDLECLKRVWLWAVNFGLGFLVLYFKHSLKGQSICSNLDHIKKSKMLFS
jgi:hypothetical protein